MPDDTTAAGDDLATVVADPAVRIVVHLAQNTIDPDADGHQLSDMVECTFPGYASIELEDFDIDICANALYADAESNEPSWESGAVVTPQAITAVYMTTKVGDAAPVLTGLSVLDTPFVIFQEGQVFQCKAFVQLVADA